MHSSFTNSIFAARTPDFKVKFGFVFRSEAVVFRRYVLALLSVGLLRKFEAYLVYLSLIRSYFPRCFSFFPKFLHFTYMLLWFRLIIPSFPAQIDDMRSRFSALSRTAKKTGHMTDGKALAACVDLVRSLTWHDITTGGIYEWHQRTPPTNPVDMNGRHRLTIT